MKEFFYLSFWGDIGLFKDHVVIIPPYRNLHLLRSWGVSEGVRALQGLKGGTGMVLQGSEQGHFQGFQRVWERQ